MLLFLERKYKQNNNIQSSYSYNKVTNGFATIYSQNVDMPKLRQGYTKYI